MLPMDNSLEVYLTDLCKRNSSRAQLVTTQWQGSGRACELLLQDAVDEREGPYRNVADLLSHMRDVDSRSRKWAVNTMKTDRVSHLPPA